MYLANLRIAIHNLDWQISRNICLEALNDIARHQQFLALAYLYQPLVLLYINKIRNDNEQFYLLQNLPCNL